MLGPQANRLRQTRYFGLGLFLLLGVVLFWVYTTTLASGLTWHNNGADSGDLSAAAAVSGIAHPTGYPTYLLVARLFQSFPLGALAYRTTLLSALSAALAAVITMLVVVHTYNGPRRFAWAGGVVAGFGFGLSPLLWSQAVITEVYALHTLFVTALVLFAVFATLGPTAYRPGLIRLGSLLFGLALGNHLTTILLLPVWLALVVWRSRKIDWRALIEASLCILIGLLVYLYIPIQAAAHPPLNWGGAFTWDGFWWLVTGRGYGRLAFGLPPNLILTRLEAWASLALAQFSLPGFLVALYGALFGRFKPLVPRAITVWLLAAYSVFALGYATSDSSAYLLPAFLALAIWLGVGLATILNELTGQWQGLRPVVIALTFAVLFANAVHQLPSLDASRDLAAEDFAQGVMAQAPTNALILTKEDRDTFPLWFYHYALHQRPDLVLLDEPLWQFPWYRENLAYTYPSLVFPSGSQPSLSDFLALNSRPLCRPQLDTSPPLLCNVAP